MPTFGPTWVNLYGSTRDYLFIDQNNFLNEGMVWLFLSVLYYFNISEKME